MRKAEVRAHAVRQHQVKAHEDAGRERLVPPLGLVGTPANLLGLQRTIGNRAVGLLFHAQSSETVPTADVTVSRDAAGPRPADIAHQQVHDTLWNEGVHVTTSVVDWQSLSVRLGTATDKLGVTGAPVGVKAPQYQLIPSSDGATEYFIAKAQNAEEGTHDSFYLAPQERRTHQDPLGWDDRPTGRGKGRVYIEVTPAISSLARDGEQEHCDDYAHAYKVSLGALDSLIDDEIDGKKVAGPERDTALKRARRLVDMTMEAANLGWMGWKQSGWLAGYQALARKTADRDTNGWHTFTKILERAGDDDIVRVTAGSTAINKHPSPELITP
ncbi:hypothetical protein [Occultella kanbiaonis]|uniref:hypothetical protein n=1 Tax=Occultella kanbiaonis TaxID=2675754 RepID=UPI0013D00865|nr:hypothetical protein [Occultella kanbiaonis]